MRTIRKILVFILFIYGNVALTQKENDVGQFNVDSLYQQGLNSKIVLSDLLGVWRSEDTLGYLIRFVADDFMVHILPRTHINAYGYQMINDSVVASGYAINWPPFYCILELQDPQQLEIKYFSFGSQQSITRKYFREKVEPLH